MRFVVGFGRFWYDFVVGDDWRIAAGVALVLGGGAALVAAGVRDSLVAPLIGAATLAIVFAILLCEALMQRRRRSS